MAAESGAIYVALGGNLGDVQATFLAALRQLTAEVGPQIERSRLYRTRALLPPEDVTPQPPYLNAVCRLHGVQSPLALLAMLQRLERAAGRVRAGRWAPRSLDLDLLLVGELRLTTPQLQLPHPRLHLRPFVLRPLADLAPRLQIPGQDKSVAAALAAALRQPQGDDLLTVVDWREG